MTLRPIVVAGVLAAFVTGCSFGGDEPDRDVLVGHFLEGALTSGGGGSDNGFLPTDVQVADAVLPGNREDVLAALRERFAQEGVDIECPVTTENGTPRIVREQNSSDITICELRHDGRGMGTLWAVAGSAKYGPDPTTVASLLLD